MRAKRTYGFALLLVSLILISAFSGAVYAKYINKTEFNNNTVTIQANLAEKFDIIESEVSRNELGKYSLVPGTETSGNKYILMPGVDIPKDPAIKIGGKTPLPAYLYVEVVDNITDSAVTYGLTSAWKLLTGVTGPNGGIVYVYNTKLNGTHADMNVQILEGNKIFVSQELKHPKNGFVIKFYAYMLQIPEGTTDETTIFKTALGLS